MAFLTDLRPEAYGINNSNENQATYFDQSATTEFERCVVCGWLVVRRDDTAEFGRDCRSHDVIMLASIPMSFDTKYDLAPRA